jgi:hypothetical protein
MCGSTLSGGELRVTECYENIDEVSGEAAVRSIEAGARIHV